MRLTALLFGITLFVGACGSSTGDRVGSGAGIGAGAGAVVGAVTGLSILQGVLIGAGAGAVVGGVTDQSQIDLGEPIWASGTTPANNTAVARVQAGLTKLGYNPGPIDGIKGAQTTNAITAYQRDNGLPIDGRATAELALHIESQLGSG